MQQKRHFTFAKGRFLPETEIIITVQEIQHVISTHKSKDGFYYQIQDSKIKSPETNILVKIKTKSLLSRKEFSAALKAVIKELKLEEYYQKQKLTGRLKKTKGLYIVDPNFMKNEITTDPENRFKTYMNGITYGWNNIEKKLPPSTHKIPDYGC